MLKYWLVLILISFLQFYSKLEEKHQALEAQKVQWEARTKVHLINATAITYSNKNRVNEYLNNQTSTI